MHPKRFLVLVSIAAVALGACTSAGATTQPAPTAIATQVAVATLAATAVPDVSPSPSAGPSSQPDASSGDGGGAKPTPGSIDPCSLLTTDEASTAMAKKLGAGVSSDLDPDRACTFKSGLTEVKLILAPPAPDAKTAQAYWDAERAQVPAGVSIKDLSDFDRAAYGSGAVGGVSLSALFVIDGTTFFDLYCGFPACTETASVAAARLIVGRLH